MAKALHRLCLMVTFAVACSGCMSLKQYTNHSRLFPTGIDGDQSVTFLLASHEECVSGGECRQSPVESAQREFENCLSGAVLAQNLQIKVLPAADFLRDAFPGVNIAQAPRNSEALLKRFQDGVTTNQALRYVVLVTVTTSEGPSRRALVPGGGGGFILAKSRTRSSRFAADVVDVRESRMAGTVSSEANGSRGMMVPFVLIFPLPPVPFGDATETFGCGSLGKAVAKFIAEKEQSP
jgi:hypothetical protein